jgi:alkanesulfonate monooxygenase SsuD/methylene tetrahydromethanopterin reductase-like flavin-dependent oxidoreductase (luciferase family)
MIRQARMGTMAHAKTAGLKDYERRYRELLGELSEIGFIRSGSVAPRYNYCGKANCRCHADPPQPHGPYFQWTAKVGGKTVNRRLSAREAELYQEWIGNDRRLRALIEELRAVAEQATNLILEQVVKV